MDEAEGPNLTTNGVHLNDFGYWAIHRAMFDQLVDNDQQPWRIAVDVTANTATAEGVEISDLTTSDAVISFVIAETSSPTLPPPTSEPLPPQLELSRDRLRVENLTSGTYRLSVDDQDMVTRTAAQWAVGVPIDSSPAHIESENLRDAINDKNLQFTYSWKALNQVHIVGERKSSTSGRALPQEVIQFRELANDRDAALSKRIKLKSRQWKLIRVQE